MAIKQVTVKALTISKINHIRACLDAAAGHHNLLFHRMEKYVHVNYYQNHILTLAESKLFNKLFMVSIFR